MMSGNVGIGTTSPLAMLDVNECTLLGEPFVGYPTLSLQPPCKGPQSRWNHCTRSSFQLDRQRPPWLSPLAGRSASGRRIHCKKAQCSWKCHYFCHLVSWTHFASRCRNLYAAAAGKEYYDAANTKYYYCNGTSWFPVVGGTSGQISAFNSTCPSGWTEYPSPL